VLERRPEPLELSVRIPWHVLHQVAGDARIMVGQLDHLLELATRPNVDLRVVPSEPLRVSVPGPFTLLTTAGATAPDLACEEGLRSFRYHEDPAAVRDFVTIFDRITSAALSQRHSADLIRKTREDYRRR
jgi:hypothetical protein